MTEKDQYRLIEEQTSQKKCLSPFEEGFYHSLGLTDDQLKENTCTFDGQVLSILGSEDFLDTDDYTSRHFLAERILTYWPKENTSYLTTAHQNHPEENYSEFVEKIVPILKSAHPKLEEEQPGRIAYTVIQGLIQTEVSLRDHANGTHGTSLYNLPNGKRNTMFFHLSDALEKANAQLPPTVGSSKDVVLTEGREYSLSSRT